LFRRKPLHQRLAEEGGLVDPPERPLFTGVIGEAGIHGVPRQRDYDAVVTTEAPDVEGASARFVGLEDGSLLLEEGDGSLTPLADAIEQEVKRPYRATAVRRSDTQWAVAAHGLQVIELPEPGATRWSWPSTRRSGPCSSTAIERSGRCPSSRAW
jgi:hypothetical protein